MNRLILGLEIGFPATTQEAITTSDMPIWTAAASFPLPGSGQKHSEYL